MSLEDVKQTIGERIAARKTATEAAKLIVEEYNKTPDKAKEAFRLALFDTLDVAEIVPVRLPPDIVSPAIEPMTIQQATHFEKVEMPYGQYSGERVSQVPLKYLVWLAETKDDEFKQQLKRYIRSEFIQREIEKEGL